MIKENEQVYHNHDFFDKTRNIMLLNTIAFNGSKYAKLSYDSMAGLRCSSFICHQYDITISLTAIKTTTNTVKNQKFKKKLREESIDAIQFISFSLSNFSIIY